MGPEQTEMPLRAELFSASQLESHARSLASEHKLGPSDLDARLLGRLDDNHTFLGDAYALVADAHLLGLFLARSLPQPSGSSTTTT